MNFADSIPTQNLTSTLEYIDKAIKGVEKLQDKILDDYNDGLISKEELAEQIEGATYEKALEAGIE